MGAIEATLVSGMLKMVVMKLPSLLTEEFSSIRGLTQDLKDLRDLVDPITDLLEKVGDQAIGNDVSSNWLKRLRDAAYDAEDLVDEFHMEAEKLDVNAVGLTDNVIKYLWTKPKSTVIKCKIAHKIKEIKKRFDAIVKARSDYIKIANSITVDHHAPHMRKTIGEVPSLTNVDETSIFGRNQLKLRLISKLIEPHNQHKIKIVSVFGLGGSGKTTLAKLVYNDGNIIKKHFEVILWVHVSREFAVEKLVGKLFEAIDGDKADHHALQRMSRTISNKLAGKKFLLVLDDVWTEDHLEWEQFMVNLGNGAPGSSILLTTRSRKVAEAVNSAYTCELPFLSEEDSWKVFLGSFRMAMEDLDPEFRQVGTEILNKCGGVPLAIKALAGVLRGMKRIEEWQSLRDCNLLDVEDEQHKVLNCLLLSYVHLPHHLKHCFTHCSIFPRGYVIKRRHLISQWIAHGFINPTNQAQQPEDIGMDDFDSLVNVGFLQDIEHHDSILGEETTCKMHDLLHDLSRQILHDESVYGLATIDEIRRCRYLSLTSGSRKVDSKLFVKVRALYVSGANITFDKPINKRCCVRTIILDDIRAASLPLFVSKFEHLGYLQISKVDCETLPKAISHCWNLQSIHLIQCTRLAALPKSIGKLKKLRILELIFCPNVKSLPQSIGGCDNLQSLHLSFCILKDIPDSVGNIVRLRALSITDCIELQQLQSSESLGKLCNLRTITLRSCHQLQCLPQCITLLSHLEYVDLEECFQLVELPDGIGNLKRLQVLNLQGCDTLCGLPAGFGQLTRLRKLGLFVVGGSTKHARISELENLDKLNGKLHITGINNVKDPCDAEKVHLKKKNGIRELSLDWYSRGNSWARDAVEESAEVRTDEVLLLEMEKDLCLLNSLEPPSEIEKLRVSGYRGLQLPRWMMKQSACSCLGSMQMPEQSNTVRFSHLAKVLLEDLPNLEHLRSLVDLPGIKILKLRRMPKLLELLTTRTCLASGEEEVECGFPRLSELKISDCPKLNVKPHFPSSLKKLTLDRSHEQWLSLDANPPKLTELRLQQLIESSSSGWDMLRRLIGLQILEINGSNNLRQLPESMRSLTCLLRLEILDCDNLCMLPEWLGELQSLEGLYIRDLPKISILPPSILHLTALRTLSIVMCHALHRLPEQIGELCLRNLCLMDCDALTQLPESLGELSALRTFYIIGCRGLTSLPCSIQRLSALEKLMIFNCPELASRCKEGVGEDWHLVSHIPHLSLTVD